jgi:hypothetical protein
MHMDKMEKNYWKNMSIFREKQVFFLKKYFPQIIVLLKTHTLWPQNPHEIVHDKKIHNKKC